MIKKVRNFLEDNNINKSKVLVALSGGPDSICLLYLLNNIKEEYILEIEAAYVNHGMRSKEENSLDHKLVQNHCNFLGIKLHIYTIPQGGIDEEVKNTKRSSEAVAREIRYRFFNTLISKNDYIALGHNRDDQIESMIMRFFQGSTLEGLVGIDSINGNILRPLIDVEKVDILDYLNKKSIKYNIDGTNIQNDFLRNKVRNILIPEISKIFPGYKNALSRVEDELKFAKGTVENSYPELKWNEVTNYHFEANLNNFLKVPYIIKKREIYKIYNRVLKGEVKDFRLPDRFLKPLKDLKVGDNTILDGYGCVLKSINNKLLFLKNKKRRHFFLRIFAGGDYSNSENRYIVGSDSKGNLIVKLNYPFIIRSVDNGGKENKILKKIGVHNLNYDNITIVEKDTKVVAIFSGCKIIYNKYSGKEGICLEIK